MSLRRAKISTTKGSSARIIIIIRIRIRIIYKELTESISGFHRASLLSVTFINQLMNSIITNVGVKIYNI